ncbi:serine/threonine protein phosphatase-like protein [Leishmania infantum JPCM5]|uniref:Serine/threonine-protein phosphatase n=2 Tax=Leishmania infantum TaxID=5671 RepID=A0A6L0WKW0_LEIIN|nr:serine/threonine protein phosphatase-like protein [Leishmania infantum JPCM5]CAC9463340.1 protein_phosphatase_with_EF-Hand_domains_(PPEF) [Leishmania infantum]CBZ08453.1 serine/threonine protein phosphatase-like protein [Leishmania infantum JPCM5]SUZ39990.1 protein_phosphatase_with_EF-Hand_domains_(PPEF) [Leishmania infantum]|eukprot:XP_003392305.1 serine/threonine protein phosphatase-like protein [Leishmania infantum JPCM5]
MGCDSSKESVASNTASASSRGSRNCAEKEKGGRRTYSNGSTEVKGKSGASGAHNGGSMAGAGGTMADQSRWPTCHFCHRKVPDKDYNAHTVMCDEREVTCWNSWCRQIVRQGDLQKHLEDCGRRQKAICPKCGAEILAMEMLAHRDSCQPKPCPQCGELCITRIHKWCPKTILAKVKFINGPFATEVLQRRFLPPRKEKDPRAKLEYSVARMQLLWRWIKCKGMIEETIFRSVYKEMDLKKEGFAIFKAHDKVNEQHVMAPKRSRSVIQAPVVAPATSSHYFPVNTNAPITLHHVEQMIKDIKNRVLLPYPAAWRVFTDAMNHLNTMPNVVRVSPAVGARVSNGRVIQGCKVVVVGDLHGQIADLLHILKESGMPSESNYYVFNGDYVDRGACGVEIILILFSLMLACPKYVTLNRGNHECDYMNDEYGFDVEVSTKYDRNVFRLIQRCFCALPLATLIGGKIFVVHGGPPRRRGVSINDISRIQRFRQIPIPNYSQPEEDEIFQDMLWSDPVEDIKGWRESQRGAGVEFGSDVTMEFLENNKLELIVRSHEDCLSGYEEHHNHKLLTIFSASNYDGPNSNYGAICTFIGDNLEPSYHTYQMFEDEYDDSQVVSLTDSFALTAPNIARISSFTATIGSVGFGVNKSNFMSRVLLHRRTKDNILRELRERIYQRRHRLLAYFSKLDRTNKGSLWMIEWVESMRNVLNLDLPWYFLRGYLVEVDDHSRIWYAPFLNRFHNVLQDLWGEEWRQSVCARVLQQQRMNHRSQLVSAAFNKEVVNYNEFCSVMRAIDYTTSDCQLFQLFESFDEKGNGHISGPEFLKKVQQIANDKPDPLRWDIDAMEQLQNIVIQGRSQLPSLFRVTSRDKALSRERFMAGMAQLGRCMRKQLTQPQREAIFDFMKQRVPEGEEMTFDMFLLCVYVFDRRTVAGMKSSYSLSDLNELGLAPISFRNTSFSGSGTGR